MPRVNNAPGLSSPHAQRGVAAIFAALSLITLLSAVGLAIDVGRLYYANRELQRLTDLAAIDGARVRSQCLGNAGIDEVTAEVDASLLRNRLPPLVTKVTRLGTRKVDANGLQFFQPVAAGQAADSVQVTLSRPSPARILPLFAGDDSRVLTTRAAAIATAVATAVVRAPRSSASGNFLPTYYGGAVGANVATGSGGGFISGSDVSVTVSTLVVDPSDVTSQLPDIDVPTPVLGLLSQLEATLNTTGDTAAATLVSAYADAIAVGRPGATVVPAEVLGLPLQGPYDGATASVSDILNAIAGAVSQGDPIQLPNLCALLGLDSGTVPVLPGLLCDTTITATIPQGSRPGTTNFSPILDVSDSNDDSARTASGLVRVGIKLVNPLTQKPLDLVLKAEAHGADAQVTSLSCARLGQGQNVASVTAKAPLVTFAIGDSKTFDQSFTTASGNLDNVLNDVEPVRLLTASVQDVLTNAGLGGLLSNNPLNAGFLGQTVAVSARVRPVTIGDGRSETFCMQGPPFVVTDQCNGAPALVGGITGQAAAEQLTDQISNVELTVTLPNNLPPALDTVLRQATEVLTQALSATVQPALRLVAGQMVPILQSANLVVGQAQVELNKPKITQPKIYAQ